MDDTRAKIGETTKMEQDILGLYEGGHPGWTSKLAGDYNELASTIEAPPVALYVIIAVILGVILGSVGTVAFSSEITIPPNFTAERAENAEAFENPSVD